MTDSNEMGFNDLDLTDLSKLHLSLKSNNGKIYLDARKWFKYENQTEHLPSKKGLMLEIEQWNQVIPLIQALIKQ